MGLKRGNEKTQIGGPENAESGDKFQRLGLDWLAIAINTHSLAKYNLQDLREKRCEVMRDQLLTLRFLHCPTGCCRMVAYVCQHLGPFKHGFPETFEAVGIKIKQEADDIRTTLAALNNVNQIKITCVDRKGQLIPYMAPHNLLHTPSDTPVWPKQK